MSTQKPPLIRSDSPLIRLPRTVPAIQASLLDAVRLCAQFIDREYRRVEDSLTQITPDYDRALALGPAAIMDAWAIVDTVHRLRALVDRVAGDRNQKRLFQKRTHDVEHLRNSFQHLVGDHRALTDADAPILGTLTWLCPVDIEKRTFCLWSFSPGRLRSVDPNSFVQLPAEIPT
jgi:hypothetical protein